MRSVLLIAMIAALQGAAGVSLAAAAAHVDANPLLATASQFLMIHAGAGLALAALARSEPPMQRWLAAAGLALQAGVTLFSADLAARVYLGGKLFPFAAPMGGGLTIISWIALAIWAAWGLARGRDGAAPGGR
ncbi:DUF423 domain-containing protein [Methylocystis sp. WRRC1]|uniref:DUF423 domain-containing protein n=1 Tax=Methylocystis sp. WRRC1 TaxID=1732014 RepID=UPI001D151AC7|nr:DUF423 domain-containing protein [Methylocystis sp. WRRC1]